MAQKSDWELLPDYYGGQNKPVGFWVDRHYTYFMVNGYRKCREKLMVEDVIQDVAKILIGYEKIVRVLKFKPKKGNVKGALMMRISNRIIDQLRKEKRQIFVPIGEQDYAEPESDNTEQQLFDERSGRLDQYKGELPADEQHFINLMRKYGPGKLAPIVQELGIDIEAGRKMKQRIIRKIRRSILND